MRWTDEKARPGFTDEKHTAKINNALMLQLNIAEPKKDKTTRVCHLNICSGNVPIHNVAFSAFDVKSAKERSVIEARSFIEKNIERYKNMLDALERANSEE